MNVSNSEVNSEHDKIYFCENRIFDSALSIVIYSIGIQPTSLLLYFTSEIILTET